MVGLHLLAPLWLDMSLWIVLRKNYEQEWHGLFQGHTRNLFLLGMPACQGPVIAPMSRALPTHHGLWNKWERELCCFKTTEMGLCVTAAKSGLYWLIYREREKVQVSKERKSDQRESLYVGTPKRASRHNSALKLYFDVLFLRKNAVLFYRCFLLKTREEMEDAKGWEVPSQGGSRNDGLFSRGPFVAGKMMLGLGQGGGRGMERAKETGALRPADAWQTLTLTL